MLGIRGNEIAYVGEYSSEFENDFDADAIIHANNKVLMPGLINMHTHLPMTLFRGYASDLSLDAWLNDKILPAEKKMTEDDIAIGARIACAEMMLSGTTMCLDMYAHAKTITDVIRDSGMRAAVSYAYDGAEGINKTLELSEHCKTSGEGRIRAIAALGLAYDGTDDEESIRKFIKDAIDNSKRIHLHLADNNEQAKKCIQATGNDPC